MPEQQALQIFAARVRKALLQAYLNSGLMAEGVLHIFSRTWAEGTAAKAYSTFSADVGDYTTDLEPTPVPTVNEYDARKLREGTPGRYLITNERKSGPIHVAVRGKCLAISAGYHILVCHFGLEGEILTIPRYIYDRVISRCVPGNNPNPAKADRLRSFLIPKKYIDPGAREDNSLYKVNILAAVVMEEDAFIVVDFARITQVHVVSGSRFWTEEDMSPGSETWENRLWSRFKGGPDWVLEPGEALADLDQWRQEVLKEGTDTPIIDVLLKPDGPGGGVGQHLANDLLFCCALHPDTPADILCEDDDLYGSLRENFPTFMAKFSSKTYVARCGGTPNTGNPFSFNLTSDTNFLRGFVQVYRKEEVRVPATLYDLYQSRGLLDAQHIIGAPYTKEWAPTDKQFKLLPVRFFEGGSNKRYHVIRAKPPPTWRVAYTTPYTFNDVTRAGFATTLGPASFREPMRNKLDPDAILALRKGKVGRPKKVRTGERGRPRKPLTKATIQRISEIPRSRKRSNICAEEEKENGDAESEDSVPTRRYSTRSGNK
ncbi:hypothetical protein R3P38DRAFT_2687100 [Favolaschia claudopus]|uniref:Uncharacterized protein n=1 Tax=Favolaschia claudopus TaxID=2862362 RepID=A0AAW0DE05_9AGAR